MNARTLIETQQLAIGTEVPEWRPFLEQISARFSAEHHGDYTVWAEAIGQLPEQLIALHPWRKGPWQFGDIHVDTEWRSDWKWQRVAPHLDLTGHRVLDVGSGNGYFGWRMLEAGARFVLGVDPTLLFCMQHLAATALLGPAPNHVIPARLEELPTGPRFDTVLSMGVLYHRKDPVDHLSRLVRLAEKQVLIETLIVESEHSLRPEGRYARMRNVPVVPTVADTARWMTEAGLKDVQCVDITRTTTDEQRGTEWMRFESLREALDPTDEHRTIEGHPAPVRAVLLGQVERPGRRG